PFSYRNLEALKINFPQSPFIYICVHAVPVLLLVIAAEMLDRHKAALPCLNPSAHGRRHLSGEQRILGEIFKVPSTQRISVYVHTWSKPIGDPVGFHFFSDCFSHPFDQFRIPCLRQCSSHRKRGGKLIDTGLPLRISKHHYLHWFRQTPHDRNIG